MTDAKNLKWLPLTDEVIEGLTMMRKNVLTKINGGKFNRDAASQAYKITGALTRYADFGSGCPSTMQHGPGHQSTCECQRKPGHKGKHRGEAMGTMWQWDGLVFYGGHDREHAEEWGE